jgi:hypothetical protein
MSKLRIIDGDGMSADDLAWSIIADAAELAIMLRGLSPASRQDLHEVLDGARLAAGLPPCELHLPHDGARLLA